MKALTYHGPYDVRIENVPDPTLQEPDDLLLRVTATAICGSDLHIYRGRVPGLLPGDILGHEIVGIVEEVGRGVTRVKRGDRVVVPFAIACGHCFFCKKRLFAACETTNPGRGGLVLPKGIRTGAGIFGCGHLYGGYAGGQAEYVRVPRANTGPLRLPDGLPDEKVLFLSDILPTGYQAAVNAKIEKGSSVAIFGAGPVGYMAAACARLLGAARIFMIDHHDYRLDFAAAAYGAETIHFDREPDPARLIIAATGGRGADASIDAVGFEARGCAVDTALTRLKIQGSSGHALRQAIAATRRGGTVSVAGAYGGWIHAFMFGDAFEKGLHLAMGLTDVHSHMPELLRRIARGDLTPEVIVTHHLALDEAPRGYRLFEKKQENCRKVILTPQGPPRPSV